MGELQSSLVNRTKMLRNLKIYTVVFGLDFKIGRKKKKYPTKELENKKMRSLRKAATSPLKSKIFFLFGHLPSKIKKKYQFNVVKAEIFVFPNCLR